MLITFNQRSSCFMAISKWAIRLMKLLAIRDKLCNKQVPMLCEGQWWCVNGLSLINNKKCWVIKWKEVGSFHLLRGAYN